MTLNRYQWRDIPGFAHLEISEYGDVRRKENAKTGGIKAGYVYAKKIKNGYSLFRAFLNGKAVTHMLHRMVALSFLGPPQGKKTYINHIDGNKQNNHYSNLEWCSCSENVLHSLYVLKNIDNIARGENASKSILTEEDVRNIRELYLSGVRIIDIHKKYTKVSTKQISVVARGIQRRNG